MALTYSPKITSNGLLFAVDAANNKSYSGPGRNVWRDLSGNNRHGTIVNNPTYSAANLGYFTFVKTSSMWVYTDITTSIVNPNADFTFNCWCYVNPARTVTSESIVYLGNYLAYAPNYHWVGFAYTTGKLSFRTYDGTETVTEYSVPSTGWYFLSGVRSGTNQLFYVQGSLASSGTAKNPNISMFATWRIGSTESQNSTDFFEGRISAASIYNRALTPIEIRSMFSAGRTRYNV